MSKSNRITDIHQEADYERALLDVSTSVARARDELVEASRGVARARAEHAALLAERIVLVLRARDTGMSTRKIGAVADLSEVMVRKILAQHGSLNGAAGPGHRLQERNAQPPSPKY